MLHLVGAHRESSPAHHELRCSCGGPSPSQHQRSPGEPTLWTHLEVRNTGTPCKCPRPKEKSLLVQYCWEHSSTLCRLVYHQGKSFCFKDVGQQPQAVRQTHLRAQRDETHTHTWIHHVFMCETCSFGWLTCLKDLQTTLAMESQRLTLLENTDVSRVSMVTTLWVRL